MSLPSDIDECEQKLDNCDDTFGTCTNTKGSFECSCNPGYQGDGTLSNCRKWLYVTIVVYSERRYISSVFTPPNCLEVVGQYDSGLMYMYIA